MSNENFDAEDGEQEADQDIDPDLGGGRGEEGADRGRRVGVGLGQPEMQREQSELDRRADDQEGEGGDHRPVVAGRRQALGDVVHVERAGRAVEQPDADDDEGRPDGTDDQILEGGGERPAVRPEGDQDAGGERGDFQEDEQVERIAGDRDAEQPGHAEQEGAVEQIGLLADHLDQQAARGEGKHHRADPADDQQHEGVQRIDPVLDAERRGPAAELVADDALRQHLVQQQARHREGRPGGRQGEEEGEVAPPHQDAGGRRQQREHDLEGGQVGRHIAGPSWSPISSSSMVP